MGANKILNMWNIDIKSIKTWKRKLKQTNMWKQKTKKQKLFWAMACACKNKLAYAGSCPETLKTRKHGRTLKQKF